MKSTDVKNLSYELSYEKIARFDDFLELLSRAISIRNCILCHSLGRSVLNDGLCIECNYGLNGKEKEISDLALREVNVSIPDNFQEKLKLLMTKDN